MQMADIKRHKPGTVYRLSVALAMSEALISRRRLEYAINSQHSEGKMGKSTLTMAKEIDMWHMPQLLLTDLNFQTNRRQ